KATAMVQPSSASAEKIQEVPARTICDPASKSSTSYSMTLHNVRDEVIDDEIATNNFVLQLINKD
ncbi:hypothetical protein A2U01_0110782, partial [Trifolium medium]|nr:hypothetical protein [Trifolium medium]